MASNDENSWKNTRLSETELIDTLKQNGNSEEKSLIHPRLDRKWTLPELVSLIESQGYTETDILKYYQQRRRHEKLIKLVSSDWFSIFLTYLTIEDILSLDSAFCNHNDRIEWLKLLKTLKPCIRVKNDQFADKIADWYILKNVHPVELSLRYNDGSSFTISDDCIAKLTRNGSRVKKLDMQGYFYRFTGQLINQMIFQNVAVNCPQLETLSIYFAALPDDGLEILSRTCHKLKSITLTEVRSYVRLDELLIANKNLISLNLSDLYTNSSILETLGLHCPLLETCLIEGATLQTTEIQMETFTKGCPNLKEVHLLDVLSVKTYHKLLRCLGSNNSALEKLSIGRNKKEENEANDNNIVLEREQTQSLQCLLNGCPLLKEIELYECKLSTSDVSYLLNHFLNLETLTFDDCDLCGDGLIITKEADKLKYLKQLIISVSPSLTNKSIMNIIKGCHNLEYIDICECDQLTNASLFSIAANCPNLEKINLSIDKSKIKGLLELVKKCPKLYNIISDHDDRVNFFNVTQNELKRTQGIIL